MKPKILPPAEYLRKCLRYERRTGKLFWKKRPVEHFVSEGMCRRWNGRYAGLEAGKIDNGRKSGYRRLALDKQQFLVHRVVWKWCDGTEPPDVIDHRDLNKTNNKRRNLRESTTTQNCYNSNRKGVCFSKEHNKWRAHVSVGGVKTHLGFFNSEAAALKIRKRAAKKVYGEFAR